MNITRKLIATAAAFALVLIVFLIWFMGSRNPETPAGYVGYLTQGSVFGSTKYIGTQAGPTSAGRTWMLHVHNVSVTPYTYSEPFAGPTAVLSKDNLQIQFAVHNLWKVRLDAAREFLDKYSTLMDGTKPGEIEKIAYDNFLKEPLRTYARDEIQRYDALQIKDNITKIGADIDAKVRALAKGTPFEVMSVVVGNVQYPAVVATAVEKKLANSQLLEQQKTEIEIKEAERKKRIIEAEGIARANEIIQSKLTPLYIQYEAIQAQREAYKSDNHTFTYIPVGANGVPVVSQVPSSVVDKPAK